MRLKSAALVSASRALADIVIDGLGGFEMKQKPTIIPPARSTDPASLPSPSDRAE
ncbi:hypothetical protein [Oricola sp.]|uniref:hypothetical protein n=1 Tax=Oricola sp. TaxID=1979950 RepID=UPI003BADBBAA